MKILLVIDSLGSGGAQKQIINLAKGFKGKNHEVELFYYNTKNEFFLKYLLDTKIKIHKIETTNKLYPLTKNLKIIFNLRKLLKKDYDAIISFMHIPSLYSLIAKIGIRKVKLIVCERNSSKANISFRIRLLSFFTCLFSDSIVANSYCETKVLKKRFPYKKNIYTIWNGYDLDNLINEKTIVFNFKKKLLVIGRITYQKNGYNLLKSLKIFYEKNGWIPEINWAGRIDLNDKKSMIMKQKMDRFLSKNPIIKSRFNLLGEVHDIDKLYKESDALIHVSRYEGFANAICESMLNDCLVICSDVSDNFLVIGSKRGILCNHLKPESISNSIALVYEMDKNKKMEYVSNAKKFAIKNFSLEKMTNLYEDILKNKLIK